MVNARHAVVLALLSLASQEARAEPYRLPPSLPPSAPEAPSREPDDIPRRRFELALSGGIAALGCHGSAPTEATTPDPCAHLRPGPTLRLEALYRPMPLLAMGGVLSTVRFGWDGARGLGEEASAKTATWTHVGIAARAYFFERGTIEPWVSATLGAGFLSMRAISAGATEELWRNGLVTTGSVGIDVWMTAHLRVGASGGLDFQPGGGVERCTNDVCLDASAAVSRIPDHAFRAGVSVTVGAGPEL